jgi:hypothetical protein
MVNAGTPRGFYVKPDTWRVSLPRAWYRGTNAALAVPASPIAAGTRVLDGVIICRDGLLHVDGTPSAQAATHWHAALWAYLGQVGSPMTVADPGGATWTAVVEEVEDRLATGGRTFGRAWEVRVAWVEVAT